MSIRVRSEAYVFSLLAASIGTACQDVPKLPIEYETERARIGDQFDFPLCRGDLDGVDETIRAIEARTGRRRQSKIRISLYDLDGGIPCPSTPFGCYFIEEDVIATLPFALDHELVHAVAPERFFPNTSWSEGVAEAYKGEGTRNAFVPLLASGASADLNSGASVHFFRWLAETRGLEPMQRIIAGDSIDAATGASLEELAAEFEHDAPFAYPDWDPCPHPSVAQERDGVWGEEFEFDCDSPGSRALVGSFGATQRRKVALERGMYSVTLDGNAEVLGILGCQEEVMVTQPDVDVGDDGEINFWQGDGVLNEVQFSRTALPRRLDPTVEHTLELEDGVYELEISAFVDEPLVGTLSIIRLDP